MSKRNIKKSYNRILEISEDAKQITLPDSRYYRRNGKYYPSITYVLSCYPKGKFFQDWLKKVGYSADWIVKKAGEEGTQVHEMCEDYLNGKELNFLQNGIPMYNPDVWQMFLKFVDWWETYNPKLIETEVHIFSDELKVAGTYGVLWLKSSKRGPKDGAIQGKGWEMYESKRTQEENIDIFLTVKRLFDLENPKHKPVFTEFKTTAKRKL